MSSPAFISLGMARVTRRHLHSLHDRLGHQGFQMELFPNSSLASGDVNIQGPYPYKGSDYYENELG